MEYSLFEVVWSKIKGYPWWPCYISNINSEKESITLRYFGDDTTSEVKVSKILKFDDGLKKNFHLNKNKLIEQAVQQSENFRSDLKREQELYGDKYLENIMMEIRKKQSKKMTKNQNILTHFFLNILSPNKKVQVKPSKKLESNKLERKQKKSKMVMKKVNSIEKTELLGKKRNEILALKKSKSKKKRKEFSESSTSEDEEEPKNNLFSELKENKEKIIEKEKCKEDEKEKDNSKEQEKLLKIHEKEKSSEKEKVKEKIDKDKVISEKELPEKEKSEKEIIEKEKSKEKSNNKFDANIEQKEKKDNTEKVNVTMNNIVQQIENDSECFLKINKYLHSILLNWNSIHLATEKRLLLEVLEKLKNISFTDPIKTLKVIVSLIKNFRNRQLD